LVKIELVSEATDELLAALVRLIPQLTSRRPPSREELQALLRSDASSLLAARDEDASGRIVGIASLAVYRVPTGIRAIVEDVVVDASARGQGVGEALTRRCLEVARERGADSVTLTSNPARQTANRLYLRMGFSRRDTNSYIYQFA
jgi:ribosomal protein S18 acetylase RimI-like enzyme